MPPIPGDDPDTSDPAEPRPGRALFRGVLAFGLLEIPVSLYPATRETRPRLRLLHGPDRSPVRVEYVCQREDRPVPATSLVRGVAAHAPDAPEERYVALDPAELRATRPAWATLESDDGGALTLVDFVPRGAIPLAHFARPYHLVPTPAGEHGAALLAAALVRADRLALCKLYGRGAEHLLALCADEDRLLCFELRFGAELIPPPRAPRPVAAPAAPVTEAELRRAVALIEGLTVPFDPARYVDEQQGNLRRLIARKTADPEAAEAPAPDEPRRLGPAPIS